ncbi:MAG: sigma-54 dependent transcriptional regulator [Desulfomicrobiaceae bacterium]
MARILIVDDDLSLREVLEIALSRARHQVRLAADIASAWKTLERESVDLALVDLRLGTESGLELLRRMHEAGLHTPTIMITAYADTKSAMEAIRLGARDYIPKPFELDELLLLVERTLESARLEMENALLKGELHDRYGTVIAHSPAMGHVLRLAERIAPTPISVLITGESGTGKELIARTIHRQSPRGGGPFLAINCGGLPEHLVESELFGFRKGAFTGADRSKKGLVEMANGGTLFLDEVAELAPAMQVKLLRFLQERRFLPLGATEECSADVRIIAATNRPVEEEVAQGSLREDLYYRLSGVRVHLPPLRERQEDILPLAEHFLRRACAEQKRSISAFSEGARTKLLSYTYPGNVRELENIVERAVALETGRVIRPESLIIYETCAPRAHDPELSRLWSGQINLDQYLLEHERAVLQEALAKTGGHKGKAAELLGISFRQLRYRLTKTMEKDEDFSSEP